MTSRPGWPVWPHRPQRRRTSAKTRGRRAFPARTPIINTQRSSHRRSVPSGPRNTSRKPPSDRRARICTRGRHPASPSLSRTSKCSPGPRPEPSSDRCMHHNWPRLRVPTAIPTCRTNFLEPRHSHGCNSIPIIIWGKPTIPTTDSPKPTPLATNNTSKFSHTPSMGNLPQCHNILPTSHPWLTPSNHPTLRTRTAGKCRGQ